MEVLGFRKMVFLIMIMITMMANMAKSELHYVGGGKSTWAPNVNFTEWSSHEHFHVKDWLYFGYERHIYNVLEVNKTSYENCIDTDPIKNVSRGGGRDVFQLQEAKTYYFLSGGGFCWHGMKVAIDVTEYVAPAPEPTPPKSGDACGIQINHTLVVLILILMWTILLE